MNRELVTDPLGVEDLWSDLRANIKLIQAAGFRDTSVFFGFAWGKHIYEDKWYDIAMDLADLEKRVQEAESKGFGRLGSDNLYFTVEPLSLRLNYSHEADIHLSYAEENAIVAAIRQRWLDQGWLTETLKSRNYNR